MPLKHLELHFDAATPLNWSVITSFSLTLETCRLKFRLTGSPANNEPVAIPLLRTLVVDTPVNDPLPPYLIAPSLTSLKFHQHHSFSSFFPALRFLTRFLATTPLLRRLSLPSSSVSTTSPRPISLKTLSSLIYSAHPDPSTLDAPSLSPFGPHADLSPAATQLGLIESAFGRTLGFAVNEVEK